MARANGKHAGRPPCRRPDQAHRFRKLTESKIAHSTAGSDIGSSSPVESRSRTAPTYSKTHRVSVSIPVLWTLPSPRPAPPRYVIRQAREADCSDEPRLRRCPTRGAVRGGPSGRACPDHERPAGEVRRPGSAAVAEAHDDGGARTDRSDGLRRRETAKGRLAWERTLARTRSQRNRERQILSIGMELADNPLAQPGLRSVRRSRRWSMLRAGSRAERPLVPRP